MNERGVVKGEVTAISTDAVEPLLSNQDEVPDEFDPANTNKILRELSVTGAVQYTNVYKSLINIEFSTSFDRLNYEEAFRNSPRSH